MDKTHSNGIMENREKKSSFTVIVVVFVVVTGLILIVLSIVVIIYVFSRSRIISGHDNVENTSLKTRNSYEIVNLNNNGEVNFEGIAEINEFHKDQYGLDIVFHGDDHQMEIMTISSFGRSSGNENDILFELTMSVFCCPLPLRGSEYSISTDCRMTIQDIVIHMEYESKEIAQKRIKSTVGLINSQSRYCTDEEFLDIEAENIVEVEKPKYTCRGFCTEGLFENFLEINAEKVEDFKKYMSNDQEAGTEYLRTEVFRKHVSTCRDTSTSGIFLGGEDVSLRNIEKEFFDSVLDVFCSGFSVVDEDAQIQYSGVCEGDHYGLQCRKKVGMVSMGIVVEDEKKES